MSSVLVSVSVKGMIEPQMKEQSKNDKTAYLYNINRLSLDKIRDSYKVTFQKDGIYLYLIMRL